MHVEGHEPSGQSKENTTEASEPFVDVTDSELNTSSSIEEETELETDVDDDAGVDVDDEASEVLEEDEPESSVAVQLTKEAVFGALGAVNAAYFFSAGNYAVGGLFAAGAALFALSGAVRAYEYFRGGDGAELEDGDY